MGTYEVFIGNDMEGDQCIYVRRDGEYLEGDDLQAVANILRDSFRKGPELEAIDD